MKLRLLLCLLSLAFIGALAEGTNGIPPAETKPDKDLTKQISDVLSDCQKIKPGATRSDLLKIFTIEGGIHTARHREFVYRRCRYVKVNVEFTLSEPGQDTLEERPTDTIHSISKPYLEWGIID
jgi:hypothetical protein